MAEDETKDLIDVTDNKNKPLARACEDESKLTAKKKALMLKALTAEKGVVSSASSISGIGRTTHYRWLKEDEKYAKDVDDIGEDCVDFGESRLHELANGVAIASPNGGSNFFLCELDEESGLYNPVFEDKMRIYRRPPCIKAISLLLKCKGKNRGWVERIEQTGADGKPLTAPVVNVSGVKVAEEE